MIGDTWYPTTSMRTLKYFLADAAKHKARVHQLDFIGAFLQANVKDRVFVKLDKRYESYFPEHSQYFGRPLKLLKTCSSPRRPLFLHALSFECTSKLCGTFLNQFLYYFHIKKMHNTM